MNRSTRSRVIVLCALLLHAMLLEGCNTMQPVSRAQFVEAVNYREHVQVQLVDGTKLVPQPGKSIMYSVPVQGVFGSGTIDGASARSKKRHAPWTGLMMRTAIDSEKPFTKFETQWAGDDRDTVSSTPMVSFYRRDDSVVTIASGLFVRLSDSDLPGVLVANTLYGADVSPYVALVPFGQIREYRVSRYSASNTIWLAIALAALVGIIGAEIAIHESFANFGSAFSTGW